MHEKDGWSIERRIDGGDCQLVCGSGPSRVGDLWKNPRGGREENHQRRHQDVRRVHGRIAWLPVIVKVQAWIWENVVEQQRDGSVRGFDRLFLSQPSMLTSWDILLLYESFKKWTV